MKLFKVYYIHPELGEIVAAIIQGKNEAVKKANKLNKENRGRKYLVGEY